MSSIDYLIKVVKQKDQIWNDYAKSELIRSSLLRSSTLTTLIKC